jgi:hypothetical protein
MKSEVIFRVTTDLNVSTEGKSFTEKPKHQGVSIALELSGNLDREYYFDKDGQPNAPGRRVTQTTLIQGLMGTLKLRAELDNLDLEKLIYEAMAEIKKWAEREASFEPSKLKDLKG